jgi:hypothetical protein
VLDTGLAETARNLTLVLVFPESSLPESIEPLPFDAKVTPDGRLAVRWVFGKDGHDRISWRLEQRTTAKASDVASEINGKALSNSGVAREPIGPKVIPVATQATHEVDSLIRDHKFPVWAPGAGASFGALTLIFFMWIVIRGGDYPIEKFPTISVLALGVALTAAFLGGDAAAKGTLLELPRLSGRRRACG